jgi:hypothetical protein
LKGRKVLVLKFWLELLTGSFKLIYKENPSDKSFDPEGQDERKWPLIEAA